MARCEVCGNDYDKAFEVVAADARHIFDSFECAIHRMAPVCEHCQCKVIGHGTEVDGRFFCCAHCASPPGPTRPRIASRRTPEHDVNRLAAGAVAGAVGTVALNAATYADIAARGRAPSSVPADTVGTTADSLGIDLSGDGGDRTAEHRRTGIGALLGYCTGLALGVLYGAVRPVIRGLRTPTAALALGAAAMVGANAGAIAAGTTDPRRWGVKGWLADIVPHACFGLAAAGAFDALTDPRSTHDGRGRG